MAIDPDLFKGMSMPQIIASLAMDSAREIQREAAAAGAHCVDCLDTGLNRSGIFCVCSQGGKLALQGSRR